MQMVHLQQVHQGGGSLNRSSPLRGWFSVHSRLSEAPPMNVLGVLISVREMPSSRAAWVMGLLVLSAGTALMWSIQKTAEATQIELRAATVPLRMPIEPAVLDQAKPPPMSALELATAQHDALLLSLEEISRSRGVQVVSAARSDMPQQLLHNRSISIKSQLRGNYSEIKSVLRELLLRHTDLLIEDLTLTRVTSEGHAVDAEVVLLVGHSTPASRRGKS